jgi:mycothiol synthase
MALPEGYILRHPHEADLPRAQAVLDAAESIDTGEPRRHEERLATEWKDPQCQPDQDWWVVDARGSGVVAVAWVWPETAGEVTADHYVHPDHRGRGLGEVLLDAIERRAAELPSRRPGGAPRRLVVWCEDTDAVRAASLERRGFVPTRQYFEMAIDLRGELPPATWPAGVEARPFRPGIDEEAVYRVDAEAFAEHFLFEPRGQEAWRLHHLDAPDADPTLWRLAWAGETTVGFVIAVDRHEGALIDDLAVLKPWRGRGIGRALLAAAFADLRDRGQSVARLYVDAQNVTNAVRVYEAAGMHVSRRFEVLQKPLAPEERGPGP